MRLTLLSHACALEYDMKLICSSLFRLLNNDLGDDGTTILAEALAKMSCLQSIMCVFLFFFLA